MLFSIVLGLVEGMRGYVWKQRKYTWFHPWCLLGKMEVRESTDIVDCGGLQPLSISSNITFINITQSIAGFFCFEGIFIECGSSHYSI